MARSKAKRTVYLLFGMLLAIFSLGGCSAEPEYTQCDFDWENSVFTMDGESEIRNGGWRTIIAPVKEGVVYYDWDAQAICYCPKNARESRILAGPIEFVNMKIGEEHVYYTASNESGGDMEDVMAVEIETGRIEKKGQVMDDECFAVEGDRLYAQQLEKYVEFGFDIFRYFEVHNEKAYQGFIDENYLMVIDLNTGEIKRIESDAANYYFTLNENTLYYLNSDGEFGILEQDMILKKLGEYRDEDVLCYGEIRHIQVTENYIAVADTLYDLNGKYICRLKGVEEGPFYMNGEVVYYGGNNETMESIGEGYYKVKLA